MVPERVELAPLRFVYPHNGGSDLATRPSLVLYLRLRNVSDDVVFRPLDPAFNRRWKVGAPRKPYTFLEMGDRRFFGPLDWSPPRAGGRGGGMLTVIAGQPCSQELQPGEAMTTLICTDPDANAGEALRRYTGPLLWRVHLRRGLVRYKGQDKAVTAVVGVEFHSQDVVRAPTARAAATP